jgi:glycosyltransferase involved in cell wall biosynthesis
MKNNPLISIVTPVFNGKKFIEDVIKNVAEQTYSNVEHIIIDGGSTDGTVEILRKYKDSITYISEKDNGQSNAINKGFKMANGEIITWLGVDDYYATKDALTKVAKYLEDKNTNIIYGRCKTIDLSSGEENFVPQGHEVNEETMIRWWNTHSSPAQPAIFFRKNLLDECGYLDESLHYAMDHDLWLKFVTKGYQIKLVPDLFAIYQIHPESKTGSQSSKFIKEHNKVAKRYWGRKWQFKYWRRLAQYYYAKYYKFRRVFRYLKA